MLYKGEVFACLLTPKQAAPPAAPAPPLLPPPHVFCSQYVAPDEIVSTLHVGGAEGCHGGRHCFGLAFAFCHTGRCLAWLHLIVCIAS
ncbi:hypothetical protein RchiOBHm_Chr3g0497651 [Rosa chinensis]|uniref:Uncharacterized protein n=1 Tax=Rosa chinensis TaxID=74649 RepID=A0A2P6RHS5_ROSCH|nr:hypothetical protein RchiOBHm_Chr3g0497651 [Rosa chinensis]